MPLPLIGLAVGAAAVATVSYLGPLIIACVVGFVSTVSSFFVAKKIYTTQESDELTALYKEQMQRERETRAEAEKTAEYAACNVELILNRVQKQHQLLDESIFNFNQNIDDTNHANEDLERVAESIQHAATAATVTVETIATELEQLKTELTLVNMTLHNTQNALAEKENELQQTVEKLAKLEVKITADAHENVIQMSHFNEMMSDARNVLSQAPHDISIKDAEISSLRMKNTKLTSTIQTLENTVTQLTTKLIGASDANKTQLNEIRSLLSENKRLTHLIDALSKALEDQSPLSTKLHTTPTHSVRIFK